MTDHTPEQAKGWLAGTHRACDPRDTFERFAPLCPRLGITRIANITGLDVIGIPVYQCVRPNSRTLSVSQGKGLDAWSAKVSAMMESIDGWHAESVVAPTRHASWRELAAREVVADLEQVPRVTARPLDPDVLIPWIAARDLLRGGTVWLPYALVDLDRTQRGSRSSHFPSNSSGLASGNVFTEAVVHALSELIEHDANALWRLGGADPSGTARFLDLDTVDDDDCLGVIDRYRASGITVAVADITSDLGVPCYWCIAIDDPEAAHHLGYAWGQGCHPSREVALLRALTEAAQSRLTFIAGARDDITYNHYRHMNDRAYTASLLRLVRGSAAAVDFRARPSLATSSLRGDLQVLLDRLVVAGVDSVLAIDLSREELGVPVVKVVVPGLEAVVIDAHAHVAGRRLRARWAAERSE